MQSIIYQDFKIGFAELRFASVASPTKKRCVRNDGLKSVIGTKRDHEVAAKLKLFFDTNLHDIIINKI